MGTTDKIIRGILAAIIAILYLTHTINGRTALVLGVFAIVILLTSFVSFCPLYAPFGISTRKKTNN